jgi:hypothetical protein
MRGEAEEPVAPATLAISFLSSSFVLKIDLPSKTDPQVVLEQWSAGRQVLAIVE